MITKIKRLFFGCKHRWLTVDRQNVWLDGKYGCVKCGKVEKVRYLDDREWRHKQKFKGRHFVDDATLKEIYMRDTLINIDALIDEHRLVNSRSADGLADEIIEMISELERKVGDNE